MSNQPCDNPCAQRPVDLPRALDLLTSLHEGFAGVGAVVAIGPTAIEPLKAILWRTETSGIFEVRGRAVMALSALGADAALIEFIEAQRRVEDPTARAGEDATISIAARALKGSGHPRAFAVLLRLARRRPVLGAVEALAASRRIEAIPALIRGLDEDHTRAVAAAGLRSLGRASRGALLAIALAMDDCESALRRRRVAMSLISEMGLAPWQWPDVRPLIEHADVELRLYACLALLAAGDKVSAGGCRAQLATLAPVLRAPLKELALGAIAAAQRPAQIAAPPDALPRSSRTRRPLLRLTLPPRATAR